MASHRLRNGSDVTNGNRVAMDAQLILPRTDSRGFNPQNNQSTHIKKGLHR
jgi:hypothetical protein